MDYLNSNRKMRIKCHLKRNLRLGAKFDMPDFSGGIVSPGCVKPKTTSTLSMHYQ